MILERIVIGVGILLAHILNGTNLFDIGTAIKPDFMILFVIFFAPLKRVLNLRRLAIIDFD